MDMPQETRMIPCFDQCSLQKEFERHKFSLRIKGFQRLIIEVLIGEKNGF